MKKKSVKIRRALALIRSNMKQAERLEKSEFIKGLILLKQGQHEAGNAAVKRSGIQGRRWLVNYCILQGR